MNKLVKLLLLVVSTFLIANLLRSMYSRKQNKMIGNIDNCIVTVPKILKCICLVMSVVGLTIVLICLILKKKGIQDKGEMLIKTKNNEVKKIDPLMEHYWDFYYILKNQEIYFDE
ncbi:hypothetical protein [Faecalimonas sp.]